MNEIEDSGESKNLKKNLSGACVILFLLVLIYTLGVCFDLGNEYRGEKVVTLDIRATDTPEYIKYSKHKEERYLFKAQEFNCHFKIITSGLEIVKNDNSFKEQVESIRRGDNLKIDIYALDEKNISSLYYEAPVLGLIVNEKIVFSPKQIESADSHSRDRIIQIALIVEIGILISFFVVRLSKF